MVGERIDSDDDDAGPPVLLRRLGNGLEANLARARLASAGIPSFIGAPDAFAGGRSSQAGLYVPESCVADALDLLDQPPDDPSMADDVAWPDDPGRPLAFRAFVASVAGWTIVFLTIVGLLIAVPTFLYAIALAVGALRRSVARDRGLRLQVAASIAISSLGLAMSALLGIYWLAPR